MNLIGLYRNTTFLSQSPMGPMVGRRHIPQDPVTLLVAAASTGAGVVAAGSLGVDGHVDCNGLRAECVNAET